MDEFILVELIQLRVDPVATELLRQREHAIQVFRAVIAVADEYSNGLHGPELMLMFDQREVRLVTTTSSRSGRGAVHQPDAGTAASRRGRGSPVAWSASSRSAWRRHFSSRSSCDRVSHCPLPAKHLVLSTPTRAGNTSLPIVPLSPVAGFR